jgi:hypothetical protein
MWNFLVHAPVCCAAHLFPVLLPVRAKTTLQTLLAFEAVQGNADKQTCMCCYLGSQIHHVLSNPHERRNYAFIIGFTPKAQPIRFHLNSHAFVRIP